MNCLICNSLIEPKGGQRYCKRAACQLIRKEQRLRNEREASRKRWRIGHWGADPGTPARPWNRLSDDERADWLRERARSVCK